MVEAVKKTLTNPFNFTDRTTRKDFWLGFLGMWLLTMVVAFIGGFIVGIAGLGENHALTFGIGAIIGAIAGWCMFVSEIRRLHDTDKSGWWVLITLVPFIGSILLIVFLCMPAKECSRGKVL